MAKKRTQTDAGLATEGTGRKKRKAAETATAKTSKLAAGDDSDFDEDLLDDSPPPPKSKSKVKSKAALKAKPKVKTLPKRDEVGDMPLVAPGFRHFEGFSDTVRNTEIAALTKPKPDMEQSRKYGFTLKPVILTDGPLAGETLLLLRPTATFKFLDLPPEIRNIVYSYVIDGQDETQITSHKPVGKPRRPVVSGFKYKSSSDGLIWDKINGKWIGQGRTAFDLLCISKQVQAETARLLYGETIFSFHNWSDTDLFLSTVGNMRRYLRRMELPNSTRKGFGKAGTALKKLGDASDLQSLSLTHAQVCADTATIWSIGLEGYVNNLAPMIKILHKNSATADPPRSVLDVIVVESARKLGGECVHCKGEGVCYLCQTGSHSDKSCRGTNGCKVVCKEHDAHCEDLAVKLRAAVAKTLKMKV